jgi:uncharacterized membrane protein YedE/YeeE
MTARLIAALLAGLLFGCGLTVSQMINPEKVLGFLDFAAIARGDWDPSLALVMASALATTLAGYALVLRSPGPVLAPRFSLPIAREIDPRLVTGAVLFGVGWGLAGYCPGPALSALALGAGKTVLFVVSMLAGMFSYELLFSRRARSAAPETAAKDRGA